MVKLKQKKQNIAAKANMTQPADIEISENQSNVVNAVEIIGRHEKQKNKYIKRKTKTFWIIFIAVVVLIVTARLFISPVTVVGSSMLPTYKNGQLIMTYNKALRGKLKCGDVIVFSNISTNGSLCIKRVEGVPGDVIQIKNGLLYRNDEVVDEPYETMKIGGRFARDQILGENEYFVLGDNRNDSTDSRIIGAVQYDDIRYVIID